MTTLRAGDEASTSECELSPDASTLYVANRAGDDSTIATFAVSPADGSLTPKGHQLCGNHPRFFQVDPSGKWLLVNALVDKAVNGALSHPVWNLHTPWTQFRTNLAQFCRWTLRVCRHRGLFQVLTAAFRRRM